MSSKTKTLSTPASQRFWDRLGIVGSALCVIHCISTPLLLGVFSTAGLSFLGDAIFHQILSVILLLVAVLAFLPGFRTHRNLFVLVAGIIGVALIIGAGFLLDPAHRHGVELSMEIGLTVAGSVLLLGAHGANWRLSTLAECCPGH